MVHVTLKFEGSSRFNMTVRRGQKILFELFLFSLLPHPLQLHMTSSKCLTMATTKSFSSKIYFSSWTQCDMTFPGPYYSWVWYVIEFWPMKCKQKCGAISRPRLGCGPSTHFAFCLLALCLEEETTESLGGMVVAQAVRNLGYWILNKERLHAD